MIQYKYILYTCIISYLFLFVVGNNVIGGLRMAFAGMFLLFFLPFLFIFWLLYAAVSMALAMLIVAAPILFIISISFTVLLSYAFWKFWSLGLFTLVNAPTWKIWAMKGVKWAMILWIAFDIVLSLGFLVIWLLV